MQAQLLMQELGRRDLEVNPRAAPTKCDDDSLHEDSYGTDCCHRDLNTGDHMGSGISTQVKTTQRGDF